MKEAEFNDLIDCKFPYKDRPAAIALINLANSISPNSMFLVLHEICRPGRGIKVEKDTLLSLIDTWNEHMDHPLTKYVVPAARVMASGSFLSVKEALALMNEVAPFEGLYGALSIAYLSCDDVDGELAIQERKIRANWEAKTNT